MDGGVGIAGGCPKRRGGSDAADAAGDAGAADAASAADAVGSADAFAALDDLLARSDAPGEDEKGLSGTQQLSATAPPSAGGVCKGGLYWYEGEDFSRRGADPHGGGSQSDERDREAYAQLLRRQPGGRAGGGEEGEADGSVGRKRRRQMSAEVKLLIWNTHFPAHVFPRCQTQMSDPDARPRCQTQMSDPPPICQFPRAPSTSPGRDFVITSSGSRTQALAVVERERAAAAAAAKVTTPAHPHLLRVPPPTHAPDPFPWTLAPNMLPLTRPTATPPPAPPPSDAPP